MHLNYLEMPIGPDPSSLESEIVLRFGPRSDATENFGKLPPRSLFDIERDAEIQELHRQFNGFQDQTKTYLTLYQNKTRIRLYSMGCFLGLSLCLSGWLLVGPTGVSPVLSKVSQLSEPVAVAKPSQTSVTVDMAKADVPLDGKSMTSGPGTAGIPAQIARPELTPPLPSPDSGSSRPGAMVATGSPLPAAVLTSAEAPAATPSIKSPQVAAKSTLVVNKEVAVTVPAPNKSNEIAVAPVLNKKVTASAQAPEEKLFVLDAPTAPSNEQKPAARPFAAPATGLRENVAKESGAGVVEPMKASSRTANSVATPMPTSSAAVSKSIPPAVEQGKNIRHEKYGASGVITLTPTGVVVFDKERHAQRLISIGMSMPDGSVLKGVDTKTNRINTDRGDVSFD